MRAHATTCRDEILQVIPEITRDRLDGTFAASEVVKALKARGTRYVRGTIQAHIISRMCADAPDNHAVVYNDLERVARGRYRLRTPRA